MLLWLYSNILAYRFGKGSIHWSDLCKKSHFECHFVSILSLNCQLWTKSGRRWGVRNVRGELICIVERRSFQISNRKKSKNLRTLPALFDCTFCLKQNSAKIRILLGFSKKFADLMLWPMSVHSISLKSIYPMVWGWDHTPLRIGFAK